MRTNRLKMQFCWRILPGWVIAGGILTCVSAVFAASTPQEAGAPVPAADTPYVVVDEGPASPEDVEAVGITWEGFSVEAIRSTSSDPVTFRVQMYGSPSIVRLDLANGMSVPLTNLGGGLWEAQLTAAQVLYGYSASKVNHNFVGYLRVYEGAVQSLQYNTFINVVDENVPSVTPISITGRMQRTCHVVNYWNPDIVLPAGQSTLQAIVGEFYRHFGDDYDFVAVVHALPIFPANRNFRLVRNETQGLGLGIVDYGAYWGSPARLQGVIQYPITGYFDLGETAAVHEVGHRWINFCALAPLASGIPHWPIGTQARGVMGFSLVGGVGGQFNYALTLQPNGNWRMTTAPALKEYTDLDLYLMGFLPPDSVGTNFVFSDPNQPRCNGCEGPVTYFTVDDVIAAQGPRVPDFNSAQRSFRLATIVATRDRLLNADEMAFFDFFAARGQASVPLPFTSGLSSGVTKPFRVATGGRGTWRTALDVACDLTAVSPAIPTGPCDLRIAGRNPVRDEVVLEWTQPVRARAAVEIFTVAGTRAARVAAGECEAGTHSVCWLPGGSGQSRVRAGIYFARLVLDREPAGSCRIVVLR